MSEVMMAAARKLGETAARLAYPMTACPYRQSGSPVEKAAARAWVETYLHWRPTKTAVISYDDEPDTDEP